MRRLIGAVVASALLLSIAVPSALAAKPERFVVDQSEFSGVVDEIVDAECGVDLDVSMRGHVIISIWFDDEGNPTMEIDRYSTRFVISNPDTGALYRFADAGPDILEFDYEAGIIIYSLIGRSATGSLTAGRVVVPVDLETGEFGEPVFQAGKDLGDWVENICEALT
jgi:hypothetical protein